MRIVNFAHGSFYMLGAFIGYSTARLTGSFSLVHALGIDVNLVRSAVFGIGCGLAGLGGVLAAPLLTASIGMAAEMIIDAFVIVIIGGMGSFPGSLIGAVLIAFVQVFGEYYLPD